MSGLGRLFTLEVRRMLARRLLRVTIALALLSMVVAGVITFLQSDRNLQAARDRALAQRRAEIESCMAGDFGPLPGEGEPGFDERAACEGMVGVGAEDPRFHLSWLPDIFSGTSVPLIMIAWVLAASFVGAEWHAGTMTTLLTWEPRRVRVLLSKALAAVVVTFCLSILLQVLVGLALTPAAVFRGTTQGIDREWLVETLGVVGRVSFVATVAALFGFSVASIGRNAAAALGVGFVYLAVVENLIRGLRPQWAPWMLGENAAVVIVGGGSELEEVGRTLIESAGLLTGYALALLVAALVAFRQRDVT